MKCLALLGRKTVISTRFRSVFFASMVSMTVSYILMLTDNVVAGQILGQQAVAAMSLIFPLLTLLFFISYLIADGLAMMAAYAQGKGNREEVYRLFSLGVILSLGLGAVLLLLLLTGREEILAYWEISPELMDYARAYYSGLMWLPPLEFLNIFLYTFFVQEGEERICAIAFVVAFAVNAVLDVVLCRAAGTLGIGLATLTGTFVSCAVQVAFFCCAKCRLHLRRYWDTAKVLRGFWYSLYHSIDTLLLSLLPVLISGYVISRFGEGHLIVVSVIVNVLTLIIALYTGLVDCLQPMVCQYHAEENLRSVQKTMGLGIEATAALSIAVSLLGMMAAPLLPRLFGVTDDAVMAEAVLSLRLFLLFTVFLGCTLMYSNYYVYIEERNYSAFVKFTLLLALPAVGMNLGGRMGMAGMWLGIGGSFVAAFALNFLLTHLRGKRSNLLLMDKQRLRRQLSYDLDSTAEEVYALTERVRDDLAGFHLSERRRNLLRLFVEELGLHAAGRGHFQLEFSLLLGATDADPVRLIARDNGKPYDILKAAGEEDLSFREYFIDSVTADLPVRKYQAAGDENRFTLQV